LNSGIRCFQRIKIKDFEDTRLIGMLPMLENKLSKILVPCRIPGMFPGKCNTGEFGLSKMIQKNVSEYRGDFFGREGAGTIRNGIDWMKKNGGWQTTPNGKFFLIGGSLPDIR
jgi:hypothetical protein